MNTFPSTDTVALFLLLIHWYHSSHWDMGTIPSRDTGFSPFHWYSGTIPYTDRGALFLPITQGLYSFHWHNATFPPAYTVVPFLSLRHGYYSSYWHRGLIPTTGTGALFLSLTKDHQASHRHGWTICVTDMSTVLTTDTGIYYSHGNQGVNCYHSYKGTIPPTVIWTPFLPPTYGHHFLPWHRGPFSTADIGEPHSNPTSL